MPNSTLLSAQQPGDTESLTKDIHESSLPGYESTTMPRSYSVWKENFAIRSGVGYRRYARLLPQEHEVITSQLQREYQAHKKALRRESKINKARREDRDVNDLEITEERPADGMSSLENV